MSVVIERVRGAALAGCLNELALLRMRVFREYPYLYEGSLEYEQRYLASYAESPQSCLVLARDGERVIGAATATPLLAHGEQVAPPLIAAGFDARAIYYFGESVLVPEYRGRRIGHQFFDQRELAARESGFSIAAFCAVERPKEHPARPHDHVPHDYFWQKRGYQKRSDIVARFAWCDLGEAQETEKPMVFWIKELGR